MAWDVKLGTVLADLSTDIGFDLGIPGLGLETEGDITLGVEWELDLGFGLSFEDGFFFDVSDPHELLFDFDVTLPASIVGTLAFLELRGTDKSLDFDPGAGTDMRNTGLGATFKVDLFDDGGGGDGKIGFTEFGDLGLNAGVAASATAALGLELGLSGELFSEIFGEGAGDVIAGFPKVTSDFLFLWELGSRVAGGSLEDIGNNSTFLSFGDLGNQGFAAIQEGLQVVAFENVALDLGTFLS
ncbi:MAG: hypothetical protein GWM98_22025, partial [Nitrospinaceae bacterium]|nr:hypothetical protein [Nitrospinaceae bacterium]NIR56639.1 hypothetical protein [Nitrospinaceae bacterium]NIS87102.1 hypothetical protein [Nitrospinaceae bacterium]NIT83956.1 hypothetical protein [Nitrospinaceae bacterium]NIU46147.1 hypothetical protein [Nitrospinaceae bacterium]